MGATDRPVMAIVFGTRPEAIKLAPVIIEANRAEHEVATRVICSGQHRELLDGPLRLFGIQPDHHLNVMRAGQRPEQVLARVLTSLGEILLEDPADVVVVQGDTTTALAAALAAFHQRVPVAHVEAGLRSHDRYHPFPEEMNRVVIADLATYHFAPTERARQNLLADGIDDESIFVTGNTGVDALLTVAGLSLWLGSEAWRLQPVPLAPAGGEPTEGHVTAAPGPTLRRIPLVHWLRANWPLVAATEVLFLVMLVGWASILSAPHAM